MPSFDDPDRTGFPVLYLESLGRYVQWFPVTKIQFEYFLCADTRSTFDDGWYQEILQLNPRLTPTRIGERDYYRALMSGVRPSEAQIFATWYSEGGKHSFVVPTFREWHKVYTTLKTLPPYTDEYLRSEWSRLKLPDRTVTVLQRLNQTSAAAQKREGIPRTLADQMLMRLGVVEWVEQPTRVHPWGGMGQTLAAFGGGMYTPDGESPTPALPKNPDSPDAARLRYFGFRLFAGG